MLPSPGQDQATDASTQAALSRILEGTASEIGEGFFRALVQALASALGTRGAWVTEFDPERRRLRALAFWLGGQWIEDWEQSVDGTPCQVVVENRRLVHYPDRILDLYPDDPQLRGVGAVSYMGVPLSDVDGSVLGHLAVLDVQPMPDDPIRRAMFEIFAGRAAAELRRLRVERQVRARQAQLSGLIESALDAIIQLDGELRVTGMNPAAERTFETPAELAHGMPLTALISPADAPKLEGLLRELQGRPQNARSAWVAGGFTGLKLGGSTFLAEGTLSSFELDRRRHVTLILRNVDERLETERRIATLTSETEYLRTELRDLGRSGEIIGNSAPVLHALAEVRQVAPADTTVLILGETGTGKELFARALHEGSRRRSKPLVKVNCAAIPATLIESEFFGHERGAFTGATARRDGRFALADGGTIFLDEVGELPLELQGKLLRVLQEGEFEPVGSSRTRKVDVRVVAATNRDLRRAVSEGKFREDLFYRLSVFPLSVPPLRERGNDVLLLAESFARQFAARAGQRLAPISGEAAASLREYAWPGNVRELQNVIERAVITAREGKLNFERAFPGTVTGGSAPPAPDLPGVLTARELARLERENLRRALEATHWQIAGESGAAKLLGLAPSTLASRVKALRLRRHR
jgi:PAS domain S-box-containing protein